MCWYPPCIYNRALGSADLQLEIVYATGLKEEDMNKAQVGISSVGSPREAGHPMLKEEMRKRIKDRKRRGKAFELTQK